VVFSVVTFESDVNTAVGSVIALDCLSIFFMVLDRWSALSMLHLVNYALIDSFCLSNFYSKTWKLLFFLFDKKMYD